MRPGPHARRSRCSRTTPTRAATPIKVDEAARGRRGHRGRDPKTAGASWSRRPRPRAAYSVRYEITNGHGGADAAFIQVLVTEDAKIEPPTAEDQVIEPEQVVDGERGEGRPAEGRAEPRRTRRGPRGHGRGTERRSCRGGMPTAPSRWSPARERFAVAYRLTNELDELSRDGVRHRAPVPGATTRSRRPSGRRRPRTPAEEKAKFPRTVPRRARPQIVVPMNGRITLERRRHRHRAVGQARAASSPRPPRTRRQPPIVERHDPAVRAGEGLPRPGVGHLRGHRRQERRRSRWAQGHPHDPGHGRRPELRRRPADLHPAHETIEAGEAPPRSTSGSRAATRTRQDRCGSSYNEPQRADCRHPGRDRRTDRC